MQFRFHTTAGWQCALQLNKHTLSSVHLFKDVSDECVTAMVSFIQISRTLHAGIHKCYRIFAANRKWLIGHGPFVCVLVCGVVIFLYFKKLE